MLEGIKKTQSLLFVCFVNYKRKQHFLGVFPLCTNRQSRGSSDCFYVSGKRKSHLTRVISLTLIRVLSIAIISFLYYYKRSGNKLTSNPV